MNEVWNFDTTWHFIIDFRPLLQLEVTGGILICFHRHIVIDRHDNEQQFM